MQRGDRWQLDRGIARFDGGTMRATLKPGLQVLGTWPEFDLGEWLALRNTSAAGSSASGRNSLTDWLSQVDVQLDEARVFGYQLRNVQAHMTVVFSATFATAAAGSEPVDGSDVAREYLSSCVAIIATSPTCSLQRRTRLPRTKIPFVLFRSSIQLPSSVVTICAW